jgi:saccharopine dehydrogenase-like NADP-dependent oxidoreductase
MKILVLGGVGAMGIEATRDLVATSSFEEIAVADVNLAKAKELARELGDPRVRALAADVSDEASLPELFEPYDVVLNCTSYVFGLVITRAALAARRPLLDLGGLYNTPKQLALGKEAEEKGVLIVLGMGATPGVSNLMARDGASRLDRADEIHVSFATFRPIAPSPGLLSTVLDEFSPGTKRFYFQDGAHVEARPFEGAREVEFAPPVGRITTYFVPHSEIHTLPRFIPGVKRVYIRGTWRHEIMDALRHYGEIGLLSDAPLELDGVKVVPKQVLAALHLSKHPWPDDEKWAFYVNVQVEGEKNGARTTVTYNLSHPPPSEWKKSATGKVTGIPASIGAQKVAQGEVMRAAGVFSPEAVFDPVPFFDALASRKIIVTRS